MAKQNAFIRGILKVEQKGSIPSGSPQEKPAKAVTIHFEGELKAHIDTSSPVATSWEKMINYLQKNKRPVYIETDPETNIIIKLHVPHAARVMKIGPEGDITYVSFHTSSARHYLRRNNPDYTQMLEALKTALAGDSTILVTATEHDFEIIDVRELPSPFGIDEPQPPPAPPPPDPSVTLARATDLFNMMNAQSCVPCNASDPCIPYKYPRDGCWIRAHLMCYLMIAEGETPEKVWINSSGCTLLALSSNVPECHVDWCWHVAPTLMVQQPSGPDIKMVIDPSLCTEPVTVDAWKALQGDPAATLNYTSWSYYRQNGTTATQAQANNAMEEYRIDLDQLCNNYGPSPYACPIVKDCFFIIDRSTISKDEVDAMISLANPSSIDAAFYIVVDGFTPSELGITSGMLSGPPGISPNLTWNPSISQMDIKLMDNIGLEDPFHLNRRQRITWKYKIEFTGSSGFTSDYQELNLSASISTVSGAGKIYLVRQPNPYEIDGATCWLSTDLRVFQIKMGESRFAKAMASDPNDFISDVITNLNSGNTGGQTFDGISTDQQTSWLELSQKVNNVPVYNFAIAKVRYRSLALDAQNVRVFFRLFPASSTSLEFEQSTTYRRAVQGSTIIPLLGIIGGETVTIPCFAAPRITSSSVSMMQQTDPANVQVLPHASGNEIVRYFGCWLDINQTQPQFPVYPAPLDGPYSSGRKAIQELIRNQHQCLVAEIAFDSAPIPAGASPASSDKLAQRNLAIVESANPGMTASHRISHTFEIKPSKANPENNESPDELMIDWGNTPIGSTARLFLPGAGTNDILRLATSMYRFHSLVRIDGHTLQCESGGITYIPIPRSEGSNYTGLLSVDLPDSVKKGQVFTIVVHQVTKMSKARTVLTHAAAGTASFGTARRVTGSFQITIPVHHKEEILAREERLLSNLRWISGALPVSNRWYPVFSKYIRHVAGRVDALGGKERKVFPSPSGDWNRARMRCRWLAVLAALLLALALVLLLLLLLKVTSPQLLIVLVIAAVFALGCFIAAWKKRCFKRNR